ncbi:acyl-CoA dehydrogenase family protein [Sphingomonas naphthae]|uniref:Acyl-CoA dehydrogenase family protein n=1 Tax=Sphingomonas naphthae TaxID=1813468 RepID=A0ABY7TIP9_9SPHN|nr:acyl-CoA dehydrogenase family protein [Sphingomonas naphthae]WCT72194.1 acyl-CoA dehydrogenase family protein [Sphingomonas naphthae]
MDFTLPAEDDPRRIEIRSFFEDHPGASYAQLAERGYTAPNWPAPWGISADPETMIVLEQEYARAGIAHPMTFNLIAINQCGQSLLKWGTDDQRKELLPPALRCEARWCMLFSEPSGGSDLAGLRTTARREGDEYVVNGQKIWNSSANIASHGVLLARTDSTAPKHKGLTQFVIDMKTPGVTVRPIVDMSGEESEYCEVFLDEVRIPVSRRLGEEGDGWRITLEQLQTERQSMTKPGAIWGGGPTARELLDGLIATGRIKDPVIRGEAGRLYVEGEMLRLMSARHLSNKINGRPAGPEGSFGKMIASPHGQAISDLAKRSQGPAGMIRNPDVLPLPDKHFGRFSNWDYAYWFAPAGTLGVGTQEILKNAVSERILGLPREDDPDIKLPFDRTRRAAA